MGLEVDYDIGKILINSTTMLDIADALRDTTNSSESMYPSEIVTTAQNVASEVATQTTQIASNADLIAQIKTALEGKAGGGSGGSSVTNPSASSKAINFRDYNGTILYSYTKDEVLALTSLPALPTQYGLTCQGWNWSLEDMKSYVTDYGKLEIGATYITDDGKTRIYITLQEGRTSPMLGVCPKGTVTVDWGDGSTPDTLTGTSTSTVKWTPIHNYAIAGDYVITLNVSGSMGFYNSNGVYAGILQYSSSSNNRNYVYKNAIQKIEIGNGITSISNYAFQNYPSLASITIPDSVTSIGRDAFKSCYSLASITIPDSVTTSINVYTFYNCYSLTSITIPNGVTSIGNYAFNKCHSLASITIPASVTSIGDDTFYNCYSLASITIPNSVTSIGSDTFDGCHSLASITMPNGVTSVGDDTFYACYSLASITIPNGVTSIGNYAFYDCYSLAKLRFNSIAPPVVSNSNAFKNISTDCIISVPTSTLSAYTSATNYPSSSTYTYIEED